MLLTMFFVRLGLLLVWKSSYCTASKPNCVTHLRFLRSPEQCDSTAFILLLHCHQGGMKGWSKGQSKLTIPWRTVFLCKLWGLQWSSPLFCSAHQTSVATRNELAHHSLKGEKTQMNLQKINFLKDRWGMSLANRWWVNCDKHIFNPFTHKSDQFQISPAASPEI